MGSLSKSKKKKKIPEPGVVFSLWHKVTLERFGFIEA